MKKHISKIRKTRVTKDELQGDFILFFASLIISALLLFVFDIHHSLYNWPMHIEFIFNSYKPYLALVPIGTIVSFAILKLILYGMKKEI